MKWRKQMCDLWDAEGVAALVTRKGPAGFGVFCRVLDVTANAMEPGSAKCSVRYSISRWSQLLSLRGSHVRHWLGEIGLTGLVTVDWIGSDVELTIPKLLEWRDEYSRKSGPSPDTLLTKSQSQSQSQKKDAENNSDNNNGAAKCKSSTDSDNHETLLTRLNLDANMIPKNAQWTVTYLERAYEMEGQPTGKRELAEWLDEKIKFCSANGHVYPKALLLRLKELQRESRMQ